VLDKLLFLQKKYLLTIKTDNMKKHVKISKGHFLSRRKINWMVVFFLSMFSLGMVSCEKENDPKIPITGQWISSETEPYQSTAISITFNDDNTYLYTTILQSLESSTYPSGISARISGNWERKGGDIIFLTAALNLPGTDSDGDVIEGIPLGSLFGYGGYGRDLSLPATAYEPLIWHIQSLTKEVLSISINGKTETYYRSK
jgi:hypothetical protein